jgi:hypothetical protein
MEGTVANASRTAGAPMIRHRLGTVSIAILCSLLTLALPAPASAEGPWMLWVSSEIEPWFAIQTFPDFSACENGIKHWIEANEGFWGKGDPSQRRSREDGGYGLWSPVIGGHAWGVVEDNKDGAKRRVELQCLPDTVNPRRPKQR